MAVSADWLMRRRFEGRSPELIFWIVLREGRTKDNIPASLRLASCLNTAQLWFVMHKSRVFGSPISLYAVYSQFSLHNRSEKLIEKNRRPILFTVLFVTRDAIFFANFNPVLQLVGTSFPRQMDLKVIVFSGPLSLELAPKNSGSHLARTSKVIKFTNLELLPNLACIFRELLITLSSCFAILLKLWKKVNFCQIFIFQLKVLKILTSYFNIVFRKGKNHDGFIQTQPIRLDLLF